MLVKYKQQGRKEEITEIEEAQLKEADTEDKTTGEKNTLRTMEETDIVASFLQ